MYRHTDESIYFQTEGSVQHDSTETQTLKFTTAALS